MNLHIINHKILLDGYSVPRGKPKIVLDNISIFQ